LSLEVEFGGGHLFAFGQKVSVKVFIPFSYSSEHCSFLSKGEQASSSEFNFKGQRYSERRMAGTGP